VTSYTGVPVLVTGATGFLGRPLCRLLLERGAQVHVLVRPGRSLEGCRAHLADLADRAAVERAVQGASPRVVFHLGALLRGEDGVGMVRANVLGTLYLLQAVGGRAQVVHTGTAQEYGRAPAPWSEDQDPDPVSLYGATKAAATLQCCQAGAVTARLFQVYGPGQGPGYFMSDLVQAVRSGRRLPMTAGEQSRDFTWLDDVLEVLLALGLRPDLRGQVLNVCTGRPTTLREVVALLERLLGRKVPVDLGALPYRPDELYRMEGRPDRLLQAGLRLPTDLPTGLARLARAEGLL
jgi:nucleoside-diphosphate-sugar epimerase